MVQIYKYKIRLTDTQTLSLPKGWVIRHCGIQGNDICLWAEVDTNNSLESLEILLIGTGHLYNNTYTDYIGTVMLGSYVWHLYYKVR